MLLNSICPRIVPCGTPVNTSRISLISQCMLTRGGGAGAGGAELSAPLCPYIRIFENGISEDMPQIYTLWKIQIQWNMCFTLWYELFPFRCDKIRESLVKSY